MRIVLEMKEMIKEVKDKEELEKIRKLMRQAPRRVLKKGERYEIMSGVWIIHYDNGIRILVDDKKWTIVK